MRYFIMKEDMYGVIIMLFLDQKSEMAVMVPRHSHNLQ